MDPRAIVVKDLSAEFVSEVGHNVDWQEEAGDSGDGWEVIRPRTLEAASIGRTYDCEECETCQAPDPNEWAPCEVYTAAVEAAKRDGYDDPESWAENWHESNEPMMNWAWPFDARHATPENAQLLEDAHVPLVIVRFDGGPSAEDTAMLALTGGGMDLSWEIGRAYVALGFLPPASIRLPAMAERWTAWHDVVSRATRASYSVAARQLRYRQIDLRQTVKSMRERTARGER